MDQNNSNDRTPSDLSFSETSENPARTLETSFASSSAADLFLASFLILFIEILLIRYLPSCVRILSYYTNLILMATFLGLGVGCLLARTKRDLFALYPFFLLVTLVASAYFANVVVRQSADTDEFLWAIYSDLSEHAKTFGIHFVVSLFFLLAAATALPMGQRMAREMENFTPIRAYIINIAGSLLGTVAFAAISFFELKPHWWLLIACPPSLYLLRRSLPRLAVGGLALAGSLMMLHQPYISSLPNSEIFWSPYYKVIAEPVKSLGMQVYVNGSLHQVALDLSEKGSLGNETLRTIRKRYSHLYEHARGGKVLIMGAGTGNDVSIALQNGAEQIDAVEIDPVILRLGKRHPNRPYEDPRVTTYLDDARSFLQKTDKKYDTIVFGTLDSQTLLSSHSTIRLDTFMYTEECFEDVRRHLSENGIFGAYFMTSKSWIRIRLYNLFEKAFGSPPLVYGVFQDKSRLFNVLYLDGPGLSDETLPEREKFREKVGGEFRISTDNWPYLYLKKPTIPGHYLFVLFLIVATSSLCLLVFSPLRKTGIDWPYFTLGVGFMLLETKSITELSLLFGSTWVVNAFVIGGILLMIFLANIYVERSGLRRLLPAFLLLFAALAANYLIPLRLFMPGSMAVKGAVSSLFIAMPLLFAGLIFGSIFKRTTNLPRAFGSNLLGAMIGGVLEYASLLTGLKSLYLYAFIFYLLSYILLRREDALGERAAGSGGAR